MRGSVTSAILSVFFLFQSFSFILASASATHSTACQNNGAWKQRETHRTSSAVMIADNNATLWAFSPSHRSDEGPVNLVLRYQFSPIEPAWKYEFSCQSLPKLALSHSEGDIWALGCPSQQAHLSNGVALTSNVGSVSLFQWNHTKGRARIVQTIYGKNTTDQLGNSIAISADGTIIALVASARTAKEKKSAEASNYLDVYRLDEGTKKWLPLGSTIPGITKVSLSSDGTRLAAMTSRLHMKVYQYDPRLEEWKEETFQIQRPRGLSSSSMSLSGNGKVLSLLQASSAGQSIHIFHRKRVQQGRMIRWILDSSIPAPSMRHSSFGWVASLSADGTRIAVADPSHRDSSGAVYVYDYQSTTHSWTPSGDPIYAIHPKRRDALGRHLHMSQDGTHLIAKAVTYTAIYEYYGANQEACEGVPKQHPREEL